MLLSLLQTLLIACLGGVLFTLAHIPLPWLLGALTSVLVFSLATGRRMYWPDLLCSCGLLLLGYTIGRTFTAETGQRILTQFPAMITATLVTILFCSFQGYRIHKKRGVSLASGLIGSIPGGLSQMIVICTEIASADLTIVTFMQTARLLGVVFVVPFLVLHGFDMDPAAAAAVGAALGSRQSVSPLNAMVLAAIVLASGLAAARLKFPTPHLLGPVLVIATMVFFGMAAPPLPPYGLDFAQLCIGAYTGSRINIASIHNLKQFSLHTLSNVVWLVGFSLTAGYLLSYFFDIPVVTGFLCTAPGGMPEMALTSMMVNADTTIVVAFHLFRLLFILIVVPPVLRVLLRRTG